MSEIIYKELSYILTRVFFDVHNSLGRNCREKQYGDALEELLKERNIYYEREKSFSIPLVANQFTNKVDFSVERSILVEIKAKSFITKEDYIQMHRYLDASKYRLGVMVNFRSKFLRPIRIVRKES